MLIKCTKCGFENQMGAIFCRGCGEKIDMDAMNPEALAKKMNKVDGKKVWKIIDKIITITVLIVLVGGIAAAVISYGLKPYKGAQATALETAEKKLSKIGVEQINWSLPKTEFTMDEINILLKDRFFSQKKETAEGSKPETKADADSKKADSKKADAKKDDATAQAEAQAPAESFSFAKIMDNLKKTFVINNAMVSSTGKNMKVVIYTTAFGYIPLRFEVIGMIQRSDALPLKFNAKSGKIGHLPLPGSLCEKTVVNKLAPYFNSAEMERILKRASDIKMDDKNLVFEFEKEKTEEKK